MTAVKPVRAEQVRRSERKQNWTVPHCGSVVNDSNYFNSLQIFND